MLNSFIDIIKSQSIIKDVKITMTLELYLIKLLHREPEEILKQAENILYPKEKARFYSFKKNKRIFELGKA